MPVLKDRISQIRCRKPPVLGTFLERGSLYIYYNINFYFVLIYRDVRFKNIPKKPIFGIYIKWEDHQSICQLS